MIAREAATGRSDAKRSSPRLRPAPRSVKSWLPGATGSGGPSPAPYPPTEGTTSTCLLQSCPRDPEEAPPLELAGGTQPSLPSTTTEFKSSAPRATTLDVVRCNWLPGGTATDAIASINRGGRVPKLSTSPDQNVECSSVVHYIPHNVRVLQSPEAGLFTFRVVQFRASRSGLPRFTLNRFSGQVSFLTRVRTRAGRGGPGRDSLEIGPAPCRQLSPLRR